MKNIVRPLLDKGKRITDFVVEHECEACKRRRKRIQAFYDHSRRDMRDMLRRPRWLAKGDME
jgi:hypothetical protein